MPLSDAAIRKAKGKNTPYKLTDGSGLHLLITPQGSRYWRLAYRFQGKQKTLALGVYPTTSLAMSSHRSMEISVFCETANNVGFYPG
jgi:hypothetical protein